MGCSLACIAYCKVVECTRLCDEMYCTLLAERLRDFSGEAWLLEVGGGISNRVLNLLLRYVAITLHSTEYASEKG